MARRRIPRDSGLRQRFAAKRIDRFHSALADSPNHGYGVARWVREATDEELVIEDGALYTALHRLEHRGLLRADWKPSESNRRAKYYTLTAKGTRVLNQQTAAWRRSAAALSKVLDRSPRKASS